MKHASTSPAGDLPAGLERYEVPAARWAVFECRGKVPDSIVASEMYAFMDWLPDSGYRHALAPEMEVYPASDDEDLLRVLAAGRISRFPIELSMD